MGVKKMDKNFEAWLKQFRWDKEWQVVVEEGFRVERENELFANKEKDYAKQNTVKRDEIDKDGKFPDCPVCKVNGSDKVIINYLLKRIGLDAMLDELKCSTMDIHIHCYRCMNVVRNDSGSSLNMSSNGVIHSYTGGGRIYFTDTLAITRDGSNEVISVEDNDYRNEWSKIEEDDYE